MEAIDLLKLAFIILLTLVSLDYFEKVGKILLVIDTKLKRWEEILI